MALPGSIRFAEDDRVHGIDCLRYRCWGWRRHSFCLYCIASQKVAIIVADFCMLRPQVQLTMEVSGCKAIWERVLSGELDFGICASQLVNLMLEFEPLMMRADHPLANQNRITVNDLAGLTILLKEQICVYLELSERMLFQTNQNRVSK